MKIDRVFFQGKYSIHSQFLDTTMQAEGILEEGETLEQGINQLRDRLNRMADSFRINSSFEGTKERLPEEVLSETQLFKPAPPEEINLADEKTEIAIDNATTLEELEPLKVKCHTVPMFKRYQEKLNQLKK